MAEPIHSYQNLIVWQKAIELVTEIYKITEKYPQTEKFGIVQQMRRAAVSIPSNIAEGRRRRTRPDFYRFLDISFGSGAELETQIVISKKLSFNKDINFTIADSLLLEVMKMLNSILTKH